LGEQGVWPRETSQARTRLTVRRQEPSALATWLRKAQRVSTGVKTASRQVACSSRRAVSTRSAVSTSAKGRPSAWANWVRKVSIWRARRPAVEWGIEDLLV